LPFIAHLLLLHLLLEALKLLRSQYGIARDSRE